MILGPRSCNYFMKMKLCTSVMSSHGCKQVAFCKCVCVTSLEYVLWRTGLLSSKPSRQEIKGNELVPIEEKKLP